MRNATGALAVAFAATLVGFGVAADTPLAIHIHSERAMFSGPGFARHGRYQQLRAATDVG
jgi:hypothetical protein